MHASSAYIIIGSGTWRSDEIANEDLTLSSTYEVFRKSRCGSRRGGVLIAVNKNTTHHKYTLIHH